MANAHDVALFFIEIAQEQAKKNLGDPMTNLRLQKLLYFAQGWHLSRYGRPLFEEELLKWPYGPVVKSVYQKYSSFKKEGISTEESLDADAFTQDEYSLLLDVVREYDQFATSRLVDMTHEGGTPWDRANPQGVISKESIRDYFRAKGPLPAFANALKRIEVIKPHRDENGQAVISRDLAEGWDAWDAS